MDRKTYEEQMQKAVGQIIIGERPGYWEGYQKGLQRQYHGEKVVSGYEDATWKAYLDDPSTREKGQVYLDGLMA